MCLAFACACITYIKKRGGSEKKERKETKRTKRKRGKKKRENREKEDKERGRGMGLGV